MRLASALPFLLAAACQAASDPPSDPVWGKQSCSSCAMLISDPRFAAQRVSASGDHLYFDDIGCLVASIAERKGTGGQAWVRDPSGAWLPAQRARFSAGAKTPMDYGFAVSSTGTLDWTAVQAIAQKRVQRSGAP